MLRLFYYECRRLMYNKFTVGLACVIALYSGLLLQEEIVLGIADTAPFSPWSFGFYLAKSMPLHFVALLFFLTFLSSKQEQSVRVLSRAACVDPVGYLRIRYGAIALVFWLMMFLSIGIALGYYAMVFHFTAFHTLIAPLIFVTVPSFLLMMGIGLGASWIHPVCVYTLMPVVFLMGMVTLPSVLDLTGSTFMSSYPLQLGILDPTFSVPVAQLMGRGIVSVVGIVLIMLASQSTRASQSE